MVRISRAGDEIKSLTLGEMRATMNQDKVGEYLILDVRRPQEYQAGQAYCAKGGLKDVK
jgi:hypothetical protein